ncbi:MAG: hypothetical protein PHU27_06900 [Salinivirgaceae bacterium]|nr:hypothetical protein [Salinivirgaceae bacterium]MDD4746426.1 hypothetical protein [Salinivirgaceae bacterium]MDY0280158.1 hypothetical protein [Salinivirgaceae bacterium]
MVNNLKEILIGEGLGEIRFGMTQKEVKKILSAPDEVEVIPFSDEKDDAIESWHYDEHEFSLSFDKAYENRLTSIAISALDATLNGVALVDKTRTEVIKAIEKMDLGNFEEETVEEDPEAVVKLLTFFESGVSLWFENEYLTEIQWGLLDDEEESDEE